MSLIGPVVIEKKMFENADRPTDAAHGWTNKKYRVFSNTGPDPLKNHKAAKSAFNGPSSASQKNAI